MKTVDVPIIEYLDLVLKESLLEKANEKIERYEAALKEIATSNAISVESKLMRTRANNALLGK